jgi:hypothetical protein
MVSLQTPERVQLTHVCTFVMNNSNDSRAQRLLHFYCTYTNSTRIKKITPHSTVKTDFKLELNM